MTFAHLQLLWLLLVPVALLAWELTRARRSSGVSQPKILRAEAGSDSLELSALSPQLSASSRARPRAWLLLGLALSVVALARPQWGRIDEPVFDQSREILLAVDLSRSMLTPDVKPSRLDRAKLLIQSLLERLAGERIGLVVFSGTAFLQSPLSADYEILREFLPTLGPDYLPEGGTNYTALIQTALSAFNHSNSADRFLIILSDGEATDDTWKSVSAELKKKNIRVLALGIGTAAGAMIPDGQNGFVKDDRGAVVLSKLEPNTLRELADITGGVYRDASTWVDLASLIQSTVEAGQKGEFVEKNSVRLVERYQWPLAFALLCLALSFWREFPVRPKPRRLLGGARPLGAPSAPATATTVALFLFLLSTLSSQLSAQSTPPLTAHGAAGIAPSSVPSKIENPESKTPPPPSAALSKIVTRLAATPDRSGRDWAELARESVTWGQRLQSEQQPVAPGPINDALAAVDAGSALDPKTADWPKLREELTALLKKPDDQNKDQKKQDQDKKNQDKDQQQQDKNKQDQKKDDQKQSSDKSDPSQQNKDQQNPDDKNEHKDSPDNPDSKPQDGKQGEKAFGDMKDKQQQPPPPPEGDTQQVGGNPDKKPADANIDPSLAMPLQKLDQLRNQDSPAKLFKLMQGDPQPSPAKKGKNW
jgi:Ca-activated chloride channel family protein